MTPLCAAQGTAAVAWLLVRRARFVDGGGEDCGALG